jgi:hypothetical protein
VLYKVSDARGRECLIAQYGLTPLPTNHSIVSHDLSIACDSDIVAHARLYPDYENIAYDDVTKIITLPNFKLGKAGDGYKDLLRPDVGRIDIIRLHNPHTGDYADYIGKGYDLINGGVTFEDSLYGTHLLLIQQN